MATTSEARKTPVEIPVVYPSLEDDSPRYFVVSETGVVQTSVPEQPVLQEAFYLDRRGSASVSSVHLDANKKGASSNNVIATALTDQPRVLAVHRLPEGGTHDGTNYTESSTPAPVTTTLFLDLSKLRNFGTIVKIQAFASNQHASHVVLLVVDETARILSLDLDATHPSLMVPVSVQLQRAELTEFAVAAAPLRSSMLCILDPQTILLALNPFLVAVHLAVSSPHAYNDGTVAPANATTTTVWSKTQCQERRTAVGSIFSKGVDLVVGRLPPCIDMAPVTALCVADNDPRHVLSFHTDGVLRHWYWDYSPSQYRLFGHNSTGANTNKMEPKRLVEPKCVASQVPPSSTWHAQDSNAVALTARVYGGSRLAVALHIRTYTAASIEPENDTGSNGNDLSCSLLLVLDGPATNMRAEDEDNWQVTRLHVPHQAKSLVSMAFDPHSTKGQLQAVFTTMRTTTNNSTAPLYLQYPPSMLSMVSPKPVIANQQFLLPEEDWSPPVLPSTLTKTAEDTPEDRLEQVDRAYLIHLFRPTSRMPPLAMHVRRVLARLVPDQQARSLAASTSLEVETVRMMHAWRRHDETLAESSPLHKRHKTSNFFPPTTPGGSLYETLLGASEQGQETPPSFAQSPQRQLDTGTVQAHIRRWNVLLAQLSAEERQAREPLRVQWGIVGDRSNTTSAAAVVVRSNAVSVVKQVTENIDKDHEFLHKIDALFAACNPDTTSLEQKVSETVAAAATLKETTLESLMGYIVEFSENISLVAGVHLEEIEEWVEQLQSPGNVSLVCTYRHDPYALVGAAADDENRNTTGQLLSCQQRLAVTALAVQSMEHFRRVLLGRLLVGVSLSCELELKSLLRVYLQATNALWVASQHVGMRYPGRPSQSLGSSETTGTVSVLAPWNIRMRTTAMDSFLIYLAGQCNAQDHATASENTARLAKISVDAFLGFGYKQNSDNSDLPELGALPPTTGSLTNEAALALRLLAVHVASPDEKEDDQVASLRKEVFAECLLIASSSVKASKADEMVSRAIGLLKFNAENMSTSMKYVQLISRRLKGSQKHHPVLADYLETAIGETPSANHSDACKLWAILFDISVAVNDWPAAFTASQSGPDPWRRLESLKRFVRAVVDAGSLPKLLAMCGTTASLVNRTVHLDAVVNSSELYEIAAETLSENAGRDMYSLLALDTEPLSDYSGALYALHESQQNWKRAAESLLARVRQGKRAIVKQSESVTLPPDTYARRESLIVEDVALSTAGCDLALKQTEDAYVASAKPSSFGRTERISPAFNTAADLSAQAIVTMSLKALFYDKLGAFRPFALAAIAEDSLPHEHMVDALDHLFTSGFYHAGLMVAEARCKLLAGHPYGINPFNEAMTHLLCTYLVPLSSGALAAEGQRPSLLQIASAFDAFKVNPAESVPSLLALRSGTKASGMYFGAVRSGTGALTHALTVGHASLDQSLAIEVAACVLDSPECCSKIPAWLEVLLVCGTRKGDECGLFSKRLDIQDAKGIYPGHPAALLDLYLKRGLYANACHVVSSALRGSGTLDRQTVAPSRLPEKGDMDIVPYAKIDVLWNLIEDALKGGIFDKAESEEIFSARGAMEKALEKHFQLLRVSEMGLMSARAVL